jgi:arylsulfatase
MPLGVLHCWAKPDGPQKIENIGPLNTKRMQTVDEELLKASLDFIVRAHKSNTQFFVWFKSTRMHIFTHLKKESQFSPNRLPLKH